MLISSTSLVLACRSDSESYSRFESCHIILGLGSGRNSCGIRAYPVILCGLGHMGPNENVRGLNGEDCDTQKYDKCVFALSPTSGILVISILSGSLIICSLRNYFGLEPKLCANFICLIEITSRMGLIAPTIKPQKA